ncbi:MAG UNVERIFIED_CONTAM: hypothetical protein LVR18_45490 [Planctomycetaceae bacterium]
MESPSPSSRSRQDVNHGYSSLELSESDIATHNVPEQGQVVQVRARQWVVTEVKPGTLPSPAMQLPGSSAQTLLTLASIEDDGLGEELQVVWEIEPGARIIEKVALPEPTGFDSPQTLDAFLDAVRWGASSSADHKNIQAPFRSGIELEDYQLDPVVRAIQMPRVNLLIADDVGLGKTIEAGMVALELMLRHLRPPHPHRLPLVPADPVEGTDARQIRSRFSHRGFQPDA